MTSVLIVEDSKSQRECIEHILGNAGYSTVACNDGFEALSHIKKSSFDLVITDVHMPKMDGIRLTAILHHRNNGTPMLVISADKCDETKQCLKDNGVAGWLQKPVDATRLLTAVSSMTE